MKKIAIIGSNIRVLNFIHAVIDQQGFSLRNVVMSIENTVIPKTHKIMGIKVVNQNALALTNAQIIIFADGNFDLENLFSLIKIEKQIIINMTSVEVFDFFAAKKSSMAFNLVSNDELIPGKSTVFVNTTCTDKYILKQVEGFIGFFGEVLYINKNLIESAFLLKNCTNIFLMRFIRSVSNAAMNLGLDSQTAFYVTTKSIKESIYSLELGQTNTEMEIDKLLIINKYLIEGLNELEENGFSFSLLKGMGAAKKKQIQNNQILCTN